MWQDGLALLIVVVAAVALVRIFAPKFRLGAGRERDAGAAQNPASGCSGCAIGGSCGSAQIKVHSSRRH